MSGRIWTEDQKKAIEISGKSVLVSAAAGSGKTASLVERVIRKITSKEAPIDADRLLIVTFTNAAAAEMRKRISDILGDLIEKNPDDLNLKRQQSLLKHASISTVHSFCFNVVKENFYRLDISPNFRIADENEILLLKERAIEKVLEKFYEHGENSFFKTVELFSNEKDDSGVVKIVRELYEFVSSYPYPEIWFKEKIEIYKRESGILRTPWGKTIICYVLDALECSEELIKSLLLFINDDSAIKEIYEETLLEDLNKINAIKETLNEENWDKTKKILEEPKRVKKKRTPGDYKDDINVILTNGVRDYVKKSIDKIKKQFALYEISCKKDKNEIEPIVETIFNLTKEFIKEFSLLKKEKNIVDFNDLEHLMVKLLTEVENGEKIKKSKAAEELSLNYEEIMVDEYQDTNETQDLIFKMLSKNEQNLFMVGDIKQSIYSFRQARPEIFALKKDKYDLYNIDSSNSACKIILGKNFRSRCGIIETVNFIFEKLMSKKLGGVEYNKEEALTFGASYENNGAEEPEILFEIIENKEEDGDKAEARRISEIISKMIKEKQMIKDGNTLRPVTYSDFCILLRSAKEHAAVYAKELSEQGIPAWSDVSGKFFGTPEIAVMLSLLKIIDNPIQDVPLLSVLFSPVFGFTPDELGQIRLKAPGAPLYLALKKSAEEGSSKCQKFIEKIDSYRRLCAIMPAERLINYIYNDTGYSSIVLAMKNGELRLANLRLLAEYAKDYDGKAYKGLSGFIEFIFRLQEKKEDLSPASTISEASNVVKIMSIHRSKGLEFPICIIARCSGKLNKETSDILIHDKLGLGFKLKNETGTIKYPNFIRNAIKIEIEKEEMAEELRVLYVALTRAKEKLIFVMSFKELEKAIISIDKKYGTKSSRLRGAIYKAANKNKIHPYIIKNASNYSEWLLECLALTDKGKEIYKYLGLKEPVLEYKNLKSWQVNISCYGEGYDDLKQTAKPDIETEELFKNKKEASLPNEIINRFNFKYPYKDINKVPVKISASKLAHEDSWKNFIASSRPAFMRETSETPAEKGTAMHEFLHFADYTSALKNLDAEIARLKEKNFLTLKQAESINKEDILNFLNSELGQRIIKSKKVLREYRFTVRAPARILEGDNIFKGEKSSNLNIAEGAGDEDKIIVQGAMDCVFEEGDEAIIVDYKTDRTKDLNSLKEKYRRQLFIYKYAFELCEGKKVKELIIYSLFTGEFSKVEQNHESSKQSTLGQKPPVNKV